jgi:hypothetical protein
MKMTYFYHIFISLKIMIMDKKMNILFLYIIIISTYVLLTEPNKNLVTRIILLHKCINMHQ